jgi:glycosyl transferase family 87
MPPMSDRASASGFLNERRLGRYAIAVALFCAVLTILLWPVLHAGQHCLDFNWIWLTGKLAAAHAAGQVYHPGAALPPDVAALPQFHCTATAGDGRFDYPPTILFFTYLLGFMPYYAAFAAWNAATLLLYLAAVYAILPRKTAVIAALTTYPVAVNLLIGHNGFLTAGLFGLALAFLERRPWLAGVFLGLLTYKPHFGILFPLALLASRNWRAFAAAALASLAFGAAAAVAFGYDLWPSFLAGMTEAATGLSHHDTVSNIIFPTVRGVLRHIGLGAQTSWTAQAAATAALAAAICVLWSRPIPYPLKAAALGIAALAATPYALSYDYCILSMAVAFLVRDGLERGFRHGEPAMLMVCWGGLSLFAFLAAVFLAGLTGDDGFGGHLLYFLVGVTPLLICAVLFGDIVLRWRRQRSEAGRPAAAPERVARNASG